MASEKSCTKDSSPPGPVPKGLIRCYSMRFCPFAQRARLVLHAKGIKHEIVNINLKSKPEWYLEKNPAGEVPTLENDCGQVVCESPITCEFLDDAYGEKKLLPTDPFLKAQQKMLLESFAKIIPYCYKIPMLRAKGEDVSTLEQEVKGKLCKLNEALGSKNFFGGESIAMIDYMIWPWFERFDCWFGLMECLDGAPGLKKWMERMQEDPAVMAAAQSVENLKGFWKSAAGGGLPNYDYGL